MFPDSSKTCTLFSSEASFSAILDTLLFIQSSISTRNLCFSVIICSHITKSFFKDAALAARFNAFEIGELGVILIQYHKTID